MLGAVVFPQHARKHTRPSGLVEPDTVVYHILRGSDETLHDVRVCSCDHVIDALVSEELGDCGLKCYVVAVNGHRKAYLLETLLQGR